MAVRVRQATLDDLDLLVAHRRGMWLDMNVTDEEALDRADVAYRGWARARLRSKRLVGFIAEDDGVPIASGCVWLQEIQPKPGPPAPRRPYLLSMFTERARRREGHARRIVEAAIAWARREGYAAMALHASEAGRHVYAPLGFEPTAEMRLKLE